MKLAFKTAAVAIISLTSFSPACEVWGQLTEAGRPKPPVAVTEETVITNWQASDCFLRGLIRAGFRNKVPMGIVLSGDALRKARPGAEKTDINIRGLIDRIDAEVPGYTAEITDGALFIHPLQIKTDTLNLLTLQIPQFRSSQGSAQTTGVNLWMTIRSVLVPTEGSGFAGGTQTGAEPLPPIQMSNSHVQTILNRIVTLGNGGIWVMSPVPPDYLTRPADMPFAVQSYSGKLEEFRLPACAP